MKFQLRNNFINSLKATLSCFKATEDIWSSYRGRTTAIR